MAGNGGGQQGRDWLCSLTWGLSGRRQPGPSPASYPAPACEGPLHRWTAKAPPEWRQAAGRGGGQPNGLSAGLSGGPKQQFPFSAEHREGGSKQAGWELGPGQRFFCGHSGPGHSLGWGHPGHCGVLSGVPGLTHLVPEACPVLTTHLPKQIPIVWGQAMETVVETEL